MVIHFISEPQTFSDALPTDLLHFNSYDNYHKNRFEDYIILM